MPTPEVLGRNGTYIVFRSCTRVAAYRRYLRAKAASREEALLGAKMVGRWQSGAAGALPGATTPLGADPQRNNDFLYGDDLRGFKCPAGAHARARTRETRSTTRKRQRPPPPHDPARHELRPDAARRRARGRRRRPRDHLRVRRCAPQAPVRVRQDPVAERRHLHRRPGRRTRSSGRTTDRAASPSRSGRSVACRACRRSSSPAAASTASPRACALRWLGEHRHREGRRGNEPRHRPLEGARLRPAAVRRGRARPARARRLRLRRARRRDHPEPAARRQRDHHRDGRG